MEIVNPTGMEVAAVAGRAYFPRHSLTVVVKGTFELVPGETVRLREDPLLPTGDEPWEDDGEPAATLRYASDFAPFKPRADLLLVGTAHAPGSRPVPRLPVELRVGDRAKSLVVFGDRWWGSGGRDRASAPEPFTAKALRYENAFGGDGFAYNPVGKGYAKVAHDEGGQRLPLPNVEYPSQPSVAPGAVVFPAGFGPTPREWPPRAGRDGTYDEAWLEHRWPWFPEDLDWTFFNAAPPDMQLEGYLRGDEAVHLRNLDPEHPRLTSRLPGLRVRCFLNEVEKPQATIGGEAGERAEEGDAPEDADGAEAEDGAFREVGMELDTLWIDADSRTLVLVWRGLAPVRSEELDEIRHLFVLSEPLADEPRPAAACRESLEALLAAEAEAAEPIDLDGIFPRDEEEAPEPDSDEDVAAAVAGMNEDLEAAGMPTVAFPSEPPAEPPPTDEEDEEMEEAWGPLSRADAEARLAGGEGLAGCDLTGADLDDMDLAGIDLAGTILVRSTLRRARLDGATLTEANLSEADLGGATLREAELVDADLTGAVLTDADLTGATLTAATLEGARLARARMDGVGAENAIFADADLTGVSALGAALPGADLARSTLRNADFREADLSEACLEGAEAAGADFSSATLRELQAGEGADLTGASFRDAEATEAIWSASILEEADLTFCIAEGAELSEAKLGRAVLTGADLSHARLTGADLSHARLLQCNLFQASLEKAVLDHADLRGANLYGAEVLDARLDGTFLDGANLKMTKLDPS